MSLVKVGKSTVHSPLSTDFLYSPGTLDLGPWSIAYSRGRLTMDYGLISYGLYSLPIRFGPVFRFCGFALVLLQVLDLLIFHGFQQGIGFLLADFHLLQLL